MTDTMSGEQTKSKTTTAVAEGVSMIGQFIIAILRSYPTDIS